MAKKDVRFEKIYAQASLSGSDMQIWVDKETGVHYLFGKDGYAGGMTVLLDAEGKPVIDKLPEYK